MIERCRAAPAAIGGGLFPVFVVTDDTSTITRVTSASTVIEIVSTTNFPFFFNIPMLGM